MRPSIGECIHILPASAQIPDAKRLIGLPDNLTIGPCRAEPGEHETARQGFWDAFHERMLRRLPADQFSAGLTREHQRSLERDVFSSDRIHQKLEQFPDSMPLILWTTPTWKDRLLLWWTVDALRRSTQIDLERVWLAESTVRDPDDASIVYPIGAYNEAQLRQAFARATPLTPHVREDSSNLWQAYAGTNPITLDRMSRERMKSFPNLFAESVPYRYGFPRLLEDGRLHLSEWDHFLLSHLSPNEWVRPIDLLIGHDPYESPFQPVYGDGFVSHRLGDWHDCREPALVSEPREGVNNITRVAYRLTELGHRLLREGLYELAEAPPMDVGGVQAYRDPWVVQWEGEDWEIIHVT